MNEPSLWRAVSGWAVLNSVLVAPLLVVATPPAWATVRQEETREPVQLEDVEVFARRGDTPHRFDRELTAADIDRIGASNIAEVLGRLRELMGDEGGSVLLINGRRIADPTLFLRLPPDALERIQALPPGTAAEYGGGGIGRTYNLVLAPRFQSREGRWTVEIPSRGGATDNEALIAANWLDGVEVSTASLQAEQTTALYARERPGYFRDSEAENPVLSPASNAGAVALAANRQIGDWTASGTLDARRDERRIGAVEAGEETTRALRVSSVQASSNLGGVWGPWFMTLGATGRWDRSDQSNVQDAWGEVRALDATLGATRQMKGLTAGPISTSLSASLSRSWSDAPAGRRRDRIDRAGATLSIPIVASAQGEEAGRIRLGALSSSLGFGATRTDDGGGRAINLGLNWTPVSRLRLAGVWATSVEAAGRGLRLDPVVLGEPIVVYDFADSAAVQVTPIRGGNPDLRPTRSETIFLSASTGPWTARRMQLQTSLSQSRSTDAVGSVLAVTPQNEAAFPERFERDMEGRLLRVDHRPLNFDAASSSLLLSTLSFELPWLGGVQVSATHTWRLSDELEPGRGLPPLDRLAGDGGGVARHSGSLRANAGRGPWTLEVQARQEGATRIRRTAGRDGDADVKIAPMTTTDLKFSYRFHENPQAGRQAEGGRQSGGLKLDIVVENVFDVFQRGRLAAGGAAPGYGRYDQDPVGRSIRIALTRRFP